MTPDGPPVPGEPQYSLHGLDPPSFVRSGVWCRNSNCRPNFRPVLLPCPAFLRSGSRNPQLESTIAVVGLVGATNAAEPTSLANASIGCTWWAARLNGEFFGIGAIREEAQPAGELNARSVQCGSTDGVLSAL